MKNSYIGREEIFFLYWKGILQPAGFKKNTIIAYIKNSMGFDPSNTNYKLTSNYGVKYNVNEFIKS